MNETITNPATRSGFPSISPVATPSDDFLKNDTTTIAPVASPSTTTTTITHRVAEGCIEGYPVLTALGTGTLASVDPTTGVHIVTIPSAGMVCYLQPEKVVRPLKAAVGEDVLTAYGEGTVTHYQARNDIYEIQLHGEQWKAKLYAKAETFDRAGDGIQHGDGTFFGLIFDMFFQRGGGGPDSQQHQDQQNNRSRSNSIASLARSTSGRSVK